MASSRLEEELSVSSQLGLEDVGRAAREGFRSIVSNRPDGEDEAQPSAANMEAEARRLGLAFAHIPIAYAKASDADVDAMARTLADMPGPILASCRTGTRSTALWAQARAPDLDAEALVRRAADVGCNISVLLPELRRRRQAGR